MRDTNQVIQGDGARIQVCKVYVRGQLYERGWWYRAEYRERLSLSYRLVRGVTVINSCRDGERLATVARVLFRDQDLGLERTDRSRDT